MREPSVSIILVNYNNVMDTLECIDSLNKVTYRNFKIFVIDNGSSDDSIKVLSLMEQECGYHLIVLKENSGFSAGNNAGIKVAFEENAEYILLLNNDTLVKENFLKNIIAYQETNMECDIAIGKIYYASDKKKIWYAGGKTDNWTAKTVHFHYGKIEKEPLRQEPIEVSFATGCFLCMKAKAVHEIGLLDEEYFLYEEDVDYCRKALSKNRHIYYVPDSVIYHKVSQSTGSGSSLTQYYTVRNHLLMIHKNYQGFRKICSYVYAFLMFFKRCNTKEYSWEYVQKGVRAYFKGEVGKKG